MRLITFPAHLMRRLSKTQRLFANVVITGVILVFGIWILSGLLNPEQSKAAWFDSNWLYRQPITITNTGSALTNYAVKVTLDTATLITAGKMLSNCNDIRFTTQQGQILPYWIEQGSPGCNDSTTDIWVKIPSIPTTGANIYIYYGNTSALNTQKPGDVFLLYDNFTSINTTTWQITTGTNSITTAGSDSASLNTKSDANDIRFYTNTSFSGGYAVKARIRQDQTDGGIFFDVQDRNNGYLLTDRRGGGTTAFQWYKRASGTWTSLSTHTSNPSAWAATQFKTLEVARVGTSIAVKDDETAISYTTSTDTTYSSGFVGIRGNGSTGEQTVDWIIVRKAVSTEPTTAFASEEQSPGPVAYWSMDEGSGSTVNDKTGRGSNGTISGATWKPASECKVGRCLFFDGTNDSVDFGNISPTATVAGNLTISFWMKPTNITKGRQNPLGKAYGGEFDFTLETTGSLSYYHGSAGADAAPYTSMGTAADAIKQNEWQQVILTRDISTRTLKYYINGNLVKTQTYTSTYDPSVSTRSFKFGYEYAGYYQGYLDEVVIFPTVKTANEIKALYSAGSAGLTAVKGASASIGANNQSPLNNGLVGYWKMDESSWNGTAGEVIDSSGTGNNGTAVSGTEASPSAKFGNAGYFAGVDEYVTLGTPTSMTSRTYAIWVKPNTSASAAGRDGLFGENAGTRIDYGNGTGSTSFHALVLLTAGSPNYKELTGTGNGTTGWSHLALVIDNAKGEATFYVNGKLSSTATWDTATQSVNTSGAQYLGYVNSAAKYAGNLDDARLYNRALSPSEIQNLYNFAPGPVGYWNFEEGVGTIANDSSGNGKTGTLTSGPEWTQGKYGKAVKFSGASNFVGLSTPLSSPAIFTYEAWFKATSYPSAVAGIIGETNNPRVHYNTNGSVGFMLAWSEAPGYKQLTSGVLSLNQWHHVTAVADISDPINQKMWLYIDGVLSGSTSWSTGTITKPSNTHYLNFRDSNKLFQGIIDEARVYNYARTPGQIIQDMNGGHPLGGSPVGSQVVDLKMDEGYGTVANNSGNTPSLTGSINGPTWTNDGKHGKALNFDGVDDYVQINDNVALDLTSEWTVGGWFRPDETVLSGSDRQVLISKWQTSAGTLINYYLYISTAGKAIGTVGNGSASQSVTSTTTLSPNKWYHLMATFNGATGNLKIYVNGRNEATTATGYAASYANTGNVRLGEYDFAWSAYRDEYNGLMDDVKIYGSALTDEQVKIDMNQNSSLVLGTVGTSSDGITASSSAGAAYCVPGDTSSCSSPVGEWKFDEKYGVSANDSTGNANTGTLTSATWTQGKFGSAVSFNGSSSYVSAATSSTIDMTTNDFTLQAWVKTTSTSQQRIMSKRSAGNIGYELLILSTGKLDFFIGDSGGFTFSGLDTTAVNDGKWHLITAVFNRSGNVVSYIDGKQDDAVSISTRTGSISSSTSLFIGRYSVSASQYFSGSIDEPKIYNYARTAAQIAWDYNRGAPLTRWKMDECQGATINDSMGSTMSGTLTIGASGTQTSVGTCSTASTAWGNGATGKFNYSLNFDGTDDFATIYDHSALQMTSNITVSLWVKPTTLNGQLVNYPISKGSGGTSTQGWAFGINGTYTGGCTVVGQIYVYTNNTFICSPTTKVISTGSWQHMLFTNDGTTTKLYINGQLVNSGSQTFVSSTGLQVNLGRRTDATWYYKGAIDDVQIFNYALTSAQVKNIYNQNSSIRFGPQTGSP